jgi:SAM-dependent methyltransferase
MSVYGFEAKTIDGSSQSLDAYRGKVLLIVNVASKCGFTPQYKGLEEIYRRNKDKGLAVLGFPCDQFGHQEPGDPPALQVPEDCLAGHPGHRGHQVELHQVPGRQERQRGEALWLDGYAGEDREGHRGVALIQHAVNKKAPPGPFLLPTRRPVNY